MKATTQINNVHIKPIRLQGALWLLLLIACTSSFALDQSAYQLSTGDVIDIQVFGEKELSVKKAIDDTGKVSYPLLGDLKAAGRTLREMEHVIVEGLQGRYLISPRVNVTIENYRQFFVNGEVNRPGGYAFLPGLSLRKAIAVAGGLTSRASSERIFVIRDSDESKTPSKTDMEAEVSPGDIITVYEYRQVFISGEVQRPGNYDYQPELTMRKLVALAGGFTARASSGKIWLIREKGGTKTEQDAALDDMVKPGDIVTVGERFF
ncbi:MAG: SLBB domain-containing protein [Gammaproteobacteria bacterium]|nr:SLBB domain-containing protein [Gammaproteobacteria bacterium]